MNQSRQILEIMRQKDQWVKTPELKLQINMRDTNNNQFWLQKLLKELRFFKLRDRFNQEYHLNVMSGQKSQFMDQLYSKLDKTFRVENIKETGLDPAGKEKASKDWVLWSTLNLDLFTKDGGSTTWEMEWANLLIQITRLNTAYGWMINSWMVCMLLKMGLSNIKEIGEMDLMAVAFMVTIDILNTVILVQLILRRITHHWHWMLLKDRSNRNKGKFKSQLRRQQELKLINTIIWKLHRWDNSIRSLLMSKETEHNIILAKIYSTGRIYLLGNISKMLKTNREVKIQILSIKEPKIWVLKIIKVKEISSIFIDEWALIRLRLN